jgi:hypothetical protein
MYDVSVRTTLDLDDDVLAAVKELADVQRTSAGKVLSRLARQALSAASGAAPASRNGVPLLSPRPAGAPRPTMKLVNDLRDDQ